MDNSNKQNYKEIVNRLRKQGKIYPISNAYKSKEQILKEISNQRRKITSQQKQIEKLKKQLRLERSSKQKRINQLEIGLHLWLDRANLLEQQLFWSEVCYETLIKYKELK